MATDIEPCVGLEVETALRRDEVTVIPVLPFAQVAGERVVVPYLNYYVGNGFVVVPTCGHPADADMVAMIGDLYPGRETVAVDVGATLAYGGGGIHTICLAQPTGIAATALPEAPSERAKAEETEKA